MVELGRRAFIGLSPRGNLFSIPSSQQPSFALVVQCMSLVRAASNSCASTTRTRLCSNSSISSCSRWIRRNTPKKKLTGPSSTSRTTRHDFFACRYLLPKNTFRFLASFLFFWIFWKSSKMLPDLHTIFQWRVEKSECLLLLSSLDQVKKNPPTFFSLYMYAGVSVKRIYFLRGVTLLYSLDCLSHGIFFYMKYFNLLSIFLVFFDVLVSKSFGQEEAKNLRFW